MSMPVYEHFKFNIGQFVCPAYFATIPEDALRRIDKEVWQIVERTYQECPGGVQLFYVCRPQGFLTDKRGLVSLNEIEIMSMEEINAIKRS